MFARVASLLVLVGLVMAAPAAAHPSGSTLGGAVRMDQLPGVRTPPARLAQLAPEPPLTPAARPSCGPGSRPETGIQGRVPPGSAAGFTCNMTLVGQHGPSGGYKALRFVDNTGRECA